METELKNAAMVCILDYGMGNLRSVLRAFEKVGARAKIVTKQSQVETGSGLVFPGQGALPDCMKRLRETGWDSFVKDWVQADQPFFGICLGLQALFEYSQEGDVAGLGLLNGSVNRFAFSLESGIKIPHMGWNSVRFQERKNDLILDGLSASQDQFYFVHSYYAKPSNSEDVLGMTEYGDLDFCSAVRKGKMIATQFHPEKSQAVGLKLYENFVSSL
jgi:glutamine amidotransferase